VPKPTRRKAFSMRGKKVGWNLEKLRVPEVWRRLRVTGEGALVVSYDHGVNYRHEDLEGSLAVNLREVPDNGKDDDENGIPDDYCGFDFTRWKCDVLARDARQHGTLTASVMVGDGTGGFVTGVAPRAKLLPVVASGGAYLYALALQYAIERDADVVNMSFSIPDLGAARGLYRMVAEHATCAGLVLVSGAGNFQRQAEIPVQIRIPEGIPCVVCAGGVTRNLQVPGFVSLGPVEWASVPLYGDYPMPKGLVKPDVVAFPGPGIPMVSTEDEGYLPESNQRRGNSLSAPQVAGVAALILSANPELTAFRVREILEETAHDLPPKGKDPRTGCGLVDAYAAVRAARE
jgi:subtilisin family serine protease